MCLQLVASSRSPVRCNVQWHPRNLNWRRSELLTSSSARIAEIMYQTSQSGSQMTIATNGNINLATSNSQMFTRTPTGSSMTKTTGESKETRMTENPGTRLRGNSNQKRGSQLTLICLGLLKRRKNVHSIHRIIKVHNRTVLITVPCLICWTTPQIRPMNTMLMPRILLKNPQRKCKPRHQRARNLDND